MSSDSAVVDASLVGALAASDLNDLIVFWYDMYEGDAQPMSTETARSLRDGFGSSVGVNPAASHVYMFGRAMTRDTYLELVAAARAAGQRKDAAPYKVDMATVKTASCCVVIKNVKRSLHILPRRLKLASATDPKSTTSHAVTSGDVFMEVKTLMQSRGVSEIEAKPVTMKYCFGRKMLMSEDETLAAAAKAKASAKAKAKAAKAAAKAAAADGDESKQATVPSDDDDDEEDGVIASIAPGEIPPERASLLDGVNIIPASAEYLHVLYSTEYEPLPREMQVRTMED